MENFKEILLDLLSDKNLTITKFAKIINIPHTTIYDYKNHDALPKPKYAYMLAKYFNCSINFLMGLTDEPKDITLKDTYDTSLFFLVIKSF